MAFEIGSVSERYKEVFENESQTFRQAHLRKMQNHQAQRPRYGHLLRIPKHKQRQG